MRNGDQGLRKPRVYIAGPISKGNQYHNCVNGVLANIHVMQNGGLPFCPHLSALTDMIAFAVSLANPERDAITYDDWLEMDFEWIESCDILLRIPGESSGADREVEHAEKHGLIVVFGIEHFKEAVAEFHEKQEAGSELPT